ncbi:MAG: DegT/DnrJ/EryC1/StrS family aminotransferase [Promethearchaeia archaeon]
MKDDIDYPAILGGKPSFQELLGIIRPEIRKYAEIISNKIKSICKSNMLSGVDIFTKKIEHELERFLEANYVIAMSSCTTSMILTIHALNLRGSEVILPSFSFSATAHMLFWNNCTPKFVDIDKETFNIDPENVKESISPKTKAILATHIYGNPCDIDELQQIAEDYKLKLLFDGAHAMGTKYKNKRIGNMGDATAYSASPTKLLTTIEGGFISTKDKELAITLQRLRNYGNYPDYNVDLPGLNARLSEINAVIGLIQIDDLDTYIKNRNDYAKVFMKELKKISGIYFQKVKQGNISTYKDFSILIKENEFGLSRNEVAYALNKENIQTKFYFYPPIHKMDAYKKYTPKKELIYTDFISNNILSIPIYNVMEHKEIFGIINAIKKIYAYAPEIKEKIRNMKNNNIKNSAHKQQ